MESNFESPRKYLQDGLDEIEETKEEENISDHEMSFHLRLLSSNLNSQSIQKTFDVIVLKVLK